MLSRKLIKQVRRSCLQKNFHSSGSKYLHFVQFAAAGAPSSTKLGVLSDDLESVISLSDANPNIPNTLVQFLQRGSQFDQEVQKTISEKKLVQSIKDVRLLAPITHPDKVICVGLNYKDHCDEQKKPYPEQPFFFPKFPSTIIGPNDKVKLPSISKAVDWEVELAVIVGKTARNVSIEKAYDYIFGYTVAQDISARDWQTPKRNNGQWLVAKSMDQFCPLGPAIVTADEISDPHSLEISCYVNDVRKQHSTTNELIHRIDKLISFLSELFTLLPGDVILTGTPGGVGVFRDPREFLKPGDKVRSEVSSIGSFEVQMVTNCEDDKEK